MTQALRWSLVAAGEGLLIVLLLTWGTVFTVSPTIHAFQLLALAVAGGSGWLAVLWRPTRLPPALVLAPLPMLAALVVTALGSPYPSLSWPATWITAAFAGVFWLFAFQASHEAGRRNLLAVITIVVILVLISYLLSVIGAWRDWLTLGLPLTSLPLRPSNSGGLALVSTWLADLVALGTPVVVANLWSRGARVGAIALAVIALIAIALTGTRSILLIIVAASILAVLMAIRGRAGRGIVSSVVAAVIVIGIAGALVAVASSRSFDEGRSSAYAGAIVRLAESPLTGTGPGTYGVERMADPIESMGWLVFPDAHNIVLTTLAESGVIGLLGLVATVALTGWAILGAWRASTRERVVIAGALFGSATFAAHGMVDVVFAMVGITLIALAVVSIAATTTQAPSVQGGGVSRNLRTAVAAFLLIVLVVTVSVVRTESARSAVSDADTVLGADVSEAVALANRASSDAPDLVPAWWVRMLAADAAGDAAGSMVAARRIAELEGFGQEWMSVAILASRQGDRTMALDALSRARDGRPVDPMVELNAISLLGAAGDGAGADEAARRLLEVQPDIEGAARTGPAELAQPLAAVRADVAMKQLTAGDPSTAFLIALSGEDRSLVEALLGQLATTDPAAASMWSGLVDGWFGDAPARSRFEESARANPTAQSAYWAWRLAAHACDPSSAAAWDRTVELLRGSRPGTPTRLFIAPDGEAAPLPERYPSFIWRMERPLRPYVQGTWVYESGTPACAAPADQ